MEPNFRLDTANIASVAVWVRLPLLAIKYYHHEALKEIGQAIGTVLRIDTHTASEARSRFARLCVQVDINKPLIYTILIGGFQQLVTYEGISKLCFSCGRVGYLREACQYTIKQPATDKPRIDSTTRENVARKKNAVRNSRKGRGSGTSPKANTDAARRHSSEVVFKTGVGQSKKGKGKSSGMEEPIKENPVLGGLSKAQYINLMT
ncbi:hypothetical protein SO802_001740 [Lithocarpus litseifolius]|uniref:CCHC-type domain-containing protein n=1 Tax=Lithocarpus litseifolius TaxID=425828 RepID=A0AAW2E0J6_9ROSI